jgi:hypothetical protein
VEKQRLKKMKYKFLLLSHLGRLWPRLWAKKEEIASFLLYILFAKMQSAQSDKRLFIFGRPWFTIPLEQVWNSE